MPQPYQQAAPAPYPVTAMPQPYGGQSSQPYPPSYEQVVGQEGYQKQAPYNPNFPG